MIMETFSLDFFIIFQIIYQFFAKNLRNVHLRARRRSCRWMRQSIRSAVRWSVLIGWRSRHFANFLFGLLQKSPRFSVRFVFVSCGRLRKSLRLFLEIKFSSGEKRKNGRIRWPESNGGEIFLILSSSTGKIIFLEFGRWRAQFGDWRRRWSRRWSRWWRRRSW